MNRRGRSITGIGRGRGSFRPAVPRRVRSAISRVMSRKSAAVSDLPCRSLTERERVESGKEKSGWRPCHQMPPKAQALLPRYTLYVLPSNGHKTLAGGVLPNAGKGSRQRSAENSRTNQALFRVVTISCRHLLFPPADARIARLGSPGRFVSQTVAAGNRSPPGLNPWHGRNVYERSVGFPRNCPVEPFRSPAHRGRYAGEIDSRGEAYGS
jgi:hypothetical protein